MTAASRSGRDYLMRFVAKRHRQLAGVGIIEQSTGLLVEHVGIDILRLQKRDSALPLGVLMLEAMKIGRKRRCLPVDVFLGFEPAVAAIGVGAEIADQQC